jgi:hypothetical protein
VAATRQAAAKVLKKPVEKKLPTLTTPKSIPRGVRSADSSPKPSTKENVDSLKAAVDPIDAPPQGIGVYLFLLLLLSFLFPSLLFQI